MGIRLKALGLSILFISVSIAAKLLPWWALSFLGDQSVLRSTVAGLVALALVVALTAILLHRLPGYPHPSLVLLPGASRRGLGMAASGVAVGAALFGVVFAIAAITGGIKVQWIESGTPRLLGTLGAVLVATILNAAWEEFTFRGWPFSACVKAFGPHGVAVTLGAIFGLAHLMNPQWTPAAIASTALAGFLICYTMLTFQNVLVPIGLHVGWNFCQSVLTSRRFWTVTTHANPWLSGGRYGLEASAAGIMVTTLAATSAFVIFLRRQSAAGRDVRDC